jgi:hypothetical protein
VSLKRKTALPLAICFAALGMMVVSQIAGATHARPKGATPILAALAITYKQCTTGTNRQHGPPLAALSCNPPVQTSNVITVGTGDAWPGTTPKAMGFARIDVKATSPEDVILTGQASDIRCRAGSSAGCGSANTDNASVPDYAGEVQGNATIRITDHFNGPIGGGGGTDAGTIQDVPHYGLITTGPDGIPCANTSDTTIGGICELSTSANSMIPGIIQDAKRQNLELQTINVFDGGTDGNGNTTGDNTLFATQGLFVP